MKELIGHKITKILVGPDQETLVFETDKGSVTYKGYGDCCSETWFADLTGVEFLLGGVVQEAEAVDMDAVEDGRSRQESDSVYGVKFKTDKGMADLVYRNSSNGYYGGSADFVAALPDLKGFKEITTDWSA